MKRFAGWIVAALVIVLAIAVALWALGRSRAYPMTDAAEVTAEVVRISAIVPGQVVEVAVHNNQAVAAGDLLFAVDPELYELEVAKARALMATAEAELAQGERNLELERSNAEVAGNQIARASNNLALAEQTLARLEPLLEQGYVTAQEVETARTAAADAQVTYDQAVSHARGTGEFVGTLDTRQAQVDLARAGLALAERNLRNSRIHAPIAGRITGLTLAPGEYVVTGTTLFSIIDTSHWTVSALFRETDLPAIRPGDAARVFLLAAPDRPITGTVESIGWGIRSNEEAQILGMPLVANKLDWVRSARRYPVEIVLQDPPEGLTRVGVSASVRILGPDAAPAEPAR